MQIEFSWNLNTKCKEEKPQSSISTNPFSDVPSFSKYISTTMFRTRKLVNGVVYHLSPPILASGIHPYFFKLLKVLSLSRILVQFSLTCIFHHVWEKISIYGIHIRKWIESMHFYSYPSSPLKTPGTIFWKSVFLKGQEPRGWRKLWFALLKFNHKIWRWHGTLAYLYVLWFMIFLNVMTLLFW